MVESDDLLDDLVGVIVENVLLKTNTSAYDKIDAALKNKGVTFAVCYKHPQILLESLRYLPDSIRISVVSAIKKELHNFADDKGIAQFIKKISA